MLSAIFKKKKKEEADKAAQNDESNNSDKNDQKNDENDVENKEELNYYKEDVALQEVTAEEGKQEKEMEKSENYDKYIGIYPDINKIETTMAKSHRTKSPVQHVVLEVNWSGIFNEELVPNITKWKYNPNTKTEIEKGTDAWTIEIFSPSECKKMIELCEMYGFEDCGYPKSYRSNTRLITQDQELADKLYERIKASCHQRYKADGAVWEICGLNERFRWCKYVKGQKFDTHCDARFSRKADEKSFYTVNIYLNDGKSEFEGGRTCFLNSSKTEKWGMSASVTASPGLALMFNQYPDRIYHNGEQVTNGAKYLMRTDVMYHVTDIKLNAKERWKHGVY